MSALDPITTEVIRNRLRSITNEMSAAVIKTAVSPVISEARDFSCILYDREGRIVANAATVPFHLGVSAHAVQTVRCQFDDVSAGDVFAVNDPHHGGGLHPQDVIIMKPVFVRDGCIGWASASGHMIDMGGMTAGSFAPSARERYQEALMIPPVRLLERGKDGRGVWDMILNNVRHRDKVEMDLRSLVAGVNVADERMRALVATYGEPTYADVLNGLCERSEAVLRRRIGELPIGAYRAIGWAEFNEETFEVACRLDVEATGLCFDYDGSSEQCSHFFNSTPQIVKSELIVRVHQILASDVPFTDGILRPVRVRAPEGSIVNSRPPAPVGAGHMHVGLLATELGETCLKRALACSRSDRRVRITAPGGSTGMGLSSWHGANAEGAADTFLVMDGNAVGAGACLERDGIDLTGSNYGGPGLVYPDIEIVEQAYPVLYLYKRLRTNAGGAGRQRGGASVEGAFAVYGTQGLSGTTLGMRRHVPTAGLFGGYPGATTVFEVKRGAGIDGNGEPGTPRSWDDVRGERVLVASNATDVDLAAGDAFRFAVASGGGLGDPIERAAARVAKDVAFGYVSADEAERLYGVALLDGFEDEEKTKAARAAIRAGRLARAQTGGSRSKVQGVVVGDLALGIEIVERDGVRRARCQRCHAYLATAPNDWKLGAAVAETSLVAVAEEGTKATGADGRPAVVLREYFCPCCAAALEVTVALRGAPAGIDALPESYRAAGSKT